MGADPSGHLSKVFSRSEGWLSFPWRVPPRVCNGMMWTTYFQVSPHFDVLCIHSVGLLPLWLDFKQSCSAFFSCEIVFFSAGLPWQLRLFLRYAYSEAECGFLVGCTLRGPRPRAGSRLQLLFLCRRRGLSALAFSCCVTSYYKPSNWKQLHCVLLEFPGAGCRRVLPGCSALDLACCGPGVGPRLV